jgi:hypothetical protein
MYRSSLNPGLLLIAVAITLLLSPSIATASDDPVVGTEVTNTTIRWSPLLPFEALQLVVSTPSGPVHKVFSPQDDPVFDLTSLSGELDGLYKWELRVVPVIEPGARKLLQAARESGDEAIVQELRRSAKLPVGSFVASGGFRVADGSILDPLTPETNLAPRTAASPAHGELTPVIDEVVLTNADGVIRNSLCVGFDCPDNPAFSDSTILMMENNTRLKFGDTSNAPFPNNDWEIEANSNVNGGANYLGFNDCGTADNDGGCASDLVFAVEAGARQHALYVEADGDIGIGTSNPAVDIHLVTGNTPTLRLDQNGSSGFAPQVWDVAGNETNFFIRDVSNGSLLPFRIRPSAPTSAIDVASDGDVGLSTASPEANLHILESTSVATFRNLLKLESAGPPGMLLANSDNNLGWEFRATSGNNFRITDSDADGNDDGVTEFDLQAGGNLFIAGTVTTGGPTCGGGCDEVFSEDFHLESIEEHAAQMWELSHLPAVGPTTPKTPINLTERMGGILNELEKAHIYIEQLHGDLQEKSGQLEAMALVLEELRAQNSALARRVDDLSTSLKP